VRKGVIALSLLFLPQVALADNPSFGNVRVIEYCTDLSDDIYEFGASMLLSSQRQLPAALESYQAAMSFDEHIRMLELVGGSDVQEQLSGLSTEINALKAAALTCMEAVKDRKNSNSEIEIACEQNTVVTEVSSTAHSLLNACKSDYQRKN